MTSLCRDDDGGHLPVDDDAAAAMTRTHMGAKALGLGNRSGGRLRLSNGFCKWIDCDRIRLDLSVYTGLGCDRIRLGLELWYNRGRTKRHIHA